MTGFGLVGDRNENRTRRSAMTRAEELSTQHSNSVAVQVRAHLEADVRVELRAGLRESVEVMGALMDC
jgi:hypothetical protein